jgi:hypothetical protein
VNYFIGRERDVIAHQFVADLDRPRFDVANRDLGNLMPCKFQRTVRYGSLLVRPGRFVTMPVVHPYNLVGPSGTAACFLAAASSYKDALCDGKKLVMPEMKRF